MSDQYLTAINTKITKTLEDLLDLNVVAKPIDLIAKNTEEYILLTKYREMTKEALFNKVQAIVQPHSSESINEDKKRSL
jgi:hypothetical protein